MLKRFFRGGRSRAFRNHLLTYLCLFSLAFQSLLYAPIPIVTGGTTQAWRMPVAFVQSNSTVGISLSGNHYLSFDNDSSTNYNIAENKEFLLIYDYGYARNHTQVGWYSNSSINASQITNGSVYVSLSYDPSGWGTSVNSSFSATGDGWKTIEITDKIGRFVIFAHLDTMHASNNIKAIDVRSLCDTYGLNDVSYYGYDLETTSLTWNGTQCGSTTSLDADLFCDEDVNSRWTHSNPEDHYAFFRFSEPKYLLYFSYRGNSTATASEIWNIDFFAYNSSTNDATNNLVLDDYNSVDWVFDNVNRFVNRTIGFNQTTDTRPVYADTIQIFIDDTGQADSLMAYEFYIYTSDALPVEDVYATDYFLTGVGLFGLTMMIYASISVPLKFRERGEFIDKIENVAISFIIGLLGFGFFYTWVLMN